MTTERNDEIRDRVRTQIADAIKDDLDGAGESLMKEVFEDLADEDESKTCYDEMRRCIDRIGGVGGRREVALEALIKDMLAECFNLCDQGGVSLDRAIEARATRAIAGGDPRLQ